MSLAFTGNYAPLILSHWRAKGRQKVPSQSSNTRRDESEGDEIDILFLPRALRESSVGAPRGGFYRFIIGIIFSFIFIDWRETRRRGSVLVGNNYAEYYANKNRGLLQSFHFSLSLWPKLPEQTGLHPRQTFNSQQLHHRLFQEMKWKPYARGCKVQGWPGEKWPLHARS